MIRKTAATFAGALGLVLLMPAVWLLVYRAAGLPLPVGELPELAVVPGQDAEVAPAGRDSANNAAYLFERSLVRVAFALIPAEELPPTGASVSEWRSEVWPPAWAIGDSAVAGHARLMALRTDRECADESTCRIVRTLLARLVVIAAGGASAELGLEWQARPDSAERGWARMVIRRSGESWRLAQFEVLAAPLEDRGADDIMGRLFPLAPGYANARR